jgi:hypothetical protein
LGGKRISHLCRIVWPSELRPTDSVGSKPVCWTRHPHCRGVRWPVSTTEGEMLVSFGLKSPGSCLVTAPSVVLRQPLVSVEKIDVGLRCEIGILADARDPHQHPRCHQIQTKSGD